MTAPQGPQHVSALIDRLARGDRSTALALRALLSAALSGDLKTQPMRIDPIFGFEVPLALPGIDSKILNPRETWADVNAYDQMASNLVGMFTRNFEKFVSHVGPEVQAAGPVISRQAAE